MQRFVTNIWCDRNAEEAGRFYASVFPNTTSSVESTYPHEGLLDFQQEFAGKPLTVSVDLDGTRLVLINAGSEFAPNPSVSFTLNFDPLQFEGDSLAARAQLDALWAALSDGGKVMMPLQEYPFSARYGWVEDRFGVSWQMSLTDPSGDPRPFLMTSLLFSGPSQNRAADAVDRYLALFPDSELGMRVPYEEATGPASSQAVMFSDFRLGTQWFTAMDSGADEAFPFTCGMSIEVGCADQAEIDRIWDALSAVPEAEQCGWLVDPFGVNWQVVPENMAELMRRPDAFAHMMPMKKIIIDEL